MYLLQLEMNNIAGIVIHFEPTRKPIKMSRSLMEEDAEHGRGNIEDEQGGNGP